MNNSRLIESELVALEIIATPPRALQPRSTLHYPILPITEIAEAPLLPPISSSGRSWPRLRSFSETFQRHSESSAQQHENTRIETFISEIITQRCKIYSLSSFFIPLPDIYDAVEDYPVGYPRLAAFKSSEPNFSLYRSFKYLHARVILELQYDIQNLERDLAELDLIDSDNGDRRRLMSITADKRQAKREGRSRKRGELIDQIQEKLIKYGNTPTIIMMAILLTIKDEMLMKARELNAFQEPSDRDYRSVRAWFFNEKPLANMGEESFIKQREDIISLRHGREWTLFHYLVESLLRKTPQAISVSFIHVSAQIRGRVF